MITIKGSDDSDITIHKAWGEEIILHNGTDYCGKILRFKEGGKFSLHYHIIKAETWYVNKGLFRLIYIDTNTANKHEMMLAPGAIIEMEKGTPHQLESMHEEGEILEVSTTHYDEDSYRIEKGDSQMKFEKNEYLG
jgi:mannose-6-phosphate isomerase-like protein (cupin superfamily)